MASIFTKIINGEVPGYVVYNRGNYAAFLDANPKQLGHTLVVPKREVDYIFDMSTREYDELWGEVRKVADAVKRATRCRKVGIIVEGMEVSHVHVHLVPINRSGDMSGRVNNPDPRVMQELTDQIAKYLS